MCVCIRMHACVYLQYMFVYACVAWSHEHQLNTLQYLQGETELWNGTSVSWHTIGSSQCAGIQRVLDYEENSSSN